MEQIEWLYDEMKQVGTDYANIEEVKNYDERMSLLRNIDEEIMEVMEATGLSSAHSMVEFGCGTGRLAIAAAQRCKEVTAVDISELMLEYAENRAREKSCSNIKFVNSGFLNYRHMGEPADVVITQLALHHLPDFWKMIALKNISGMLKTGGRLYLRDVVFSVPLDKYAQKINGVLRHVNDTAGSENSGKFANHIKNEFSTFDWIMEEMFYRAGFYIESAEYGDSFIATYVCMKTEEFKIEK